MRIGDWSSDVCSSDLRRRRPVCGSGRQDCAPAAGAPSVVSSGGWRGLGRPVGGGSLRLGGAGEQLARIEGIEQGLTDEDEEGQTHGNGDEAVAAEPGGGDRKGVVRGKCVSHGYIPWDPEQ